MGKAGLWHEKSVFEAMSLPDFIRNRIQRDGAMPLDVFQQWALYHPEKGYYHTQAIFGKKGDFITAPETSQMFGEMVGLWLLDLWHQMGAPSPLQLVELGPGRGTLMADILRVAHRNPAFCKALQVHLVEISAPLRQEQQKRLTDFPVVWSATLKEALSQGQGPLFVIANEFFDALPIKQFEKKDGQWQERCVDWRANPPEFFLTLSPLPPEKLPSARGQEGDIWETSPLRDNLFEEILQHIKKRCGVLWISDYGYSTLTSLGDSLQGIYHQQKSPPLAHVGQTDLSSHVNFGRFTEIAKSQEMSGLGPCGQGDFLKKLGLAHRLAQLKQGKPTHVCARLEADFQRLTHFLQMGVLFQVYTAYHPESLTPCGFGNF